jgi:hypothetical protein
VTISCNLKHLGAAPPTVKKIIFTSVCCIVYLNGVGIVFYCGAIVYDFVLDEEVFQIDEDFACIYD